MILKKCVLGLMVVVSLFSVSTHTYADDKSTFDNWFVSRLSAWSPPGRTFYPEAKETSEEAVVRYQSIISDAINVVWDPAEEPIFRGPDGRVRTLALLLSIARYESGFRKDVDFGLGKYSKGDKGQSWCLMQIRLGKEVKGKTIERIKLTDKGILFTRDMNDFGGEDLVKNRHLCFKAALHMVRHSFGVCKKNVVEERLGAYTAGDCEKGKVSSRERYQSSVLMLQRAPRKFLDVDYSK